MSREERQILFEKCVANARDSELATGWFRPSTSSGIKKGNVVEWLLWALFSTHQDNFQEEWEEELHEYVHMVERLIGRPLQSGTNEQVQSMRITFDPVHAIHRPLVWYLVRQAIR